MANENNFSGQPELVWLTERGSDRNMRLIKPFWYKDWNRRRWDVKADAVIDGASIPRALWTLVGSPFTGDYRRASIVHDAYAATDDETVRREADRMFYCACRDGGCSVFEATVLYVGVRIGAGLRSGALRLRAGPYPEGARLQRSAADYEIEALFRYAAEIVLGDVKDEDPNQPAYAEALETSADSALVTLNGATPEDK
jgi:hypothetical protein